MKERYLLEEEVGENGFSLITDYDGNDEHVFDVNIKSGDILPISIFLSSFRFNLVYVIHNMHKSFAKLIDSL